MRARLKNFIWLAVMIAGILLADRLQLRPEHREPPRSRAPRSQAAKFEELKAARLVDHRDNDGDSFHLAHGDGEEHEFRLYFVDAPEKRLHQYNGRRIEEQARYFGILSVDDTVQIGQGARAFTEDLLRSRPFTVHTRWQRVFGSERCFAFVFFEESDGKREELSEKLVRAGLCRIYTQGANLPDGRRERDFTQHLRTLEQEAKAARQGAWGH